MPEELQTACFDLFYHHLQKPIRRRHSENEPLVKWIIFSLAGFGAFGRSYFDRDISCMETFVGCWARVLKWLKAIYDGQYFYDLDEYFYGLAAEVFNVAETADEELFKLDQSEAFEVAARIWTGHFDQDGKECFNGRPLLGYILKDFRSKTRLDHILAVHDGDPARVVDTMLSRLKLAYVRSNAEGNNTAIVLLSIMHFLAIPEHPLREVLLSSQTGTTLVPIAKALTDDDNFDHQHAPSVRMALGLIYACPFSGPCHANEILEKGMLDALLKMASLHSQDCTESQCECTSACGILKMLIEFLIFDYAVYACQGAFCVLYKNKARVEGFLETSSKEFQTTWEAMKIALLEHLLLSRLFECGHLTEQGTCASVSTISRSET